MSGSDRGSPEPSAGDAPGGEPLGEPTPCASAFVSAAEPAEQAKRDQYAASGWTYPLRSFAAIAIAPAAPAPTIDEHSAPFWAALAERRIVVQRCPSCERRRFPPMPACPFCGITGGVTVEIAGTGTVYSFVRAHRALTPAYADVVPYAVATVDLDGGGRMFGRVSPPEACAIGVRVEPAFADHAHEGTAAWTELYFRPAGPTVA